MNKDHRVYFQHILDSIRNIQRYIKGLSEDEFLKNPMVQDAVIRNLEIIGEAVKNIPRSERNKYPFIEWQRIAGMRDVLIHEYMGVDLEKVWAVLKGRLPSLKKQIRDICNILSSRSSPEKRK